jgi:hypothetical protein
MSACPMGCVRIEAGAVCLGEKKTSGHTFIEFIARMKIGRGVWMFVEMGYVDFFSLPLYDL